jgi:hypothetical protein
VSWWKYAGAFGGGVLGYIVANVPGLMVGGYAGNRLGAIRDAKGKPVAVVFTNLGGSQKAEVRIAAYVSLYALNPLKATAADPTCTCTQSSGLCVCPVKFIPIEVS